MNSFLFIDNETENYNYYLVESKKPLKEMKDIFEDVYAKLMKEFWSDDFSTWEYMDFYDELSKRLEPHWIYCNEPKIYYHNSFSYGD